MKSTPMIRVENITVMRNGEVIIRDVSFEYKGAGIIQILGPNGAGKTTLLKTILGLIKPVRGRIYINNVDVTGNPRLAGRYIGYTPQLTFYELSRYPITLRELVECCLIMKKKWPRLRISREDKKKVEEALKLVGLPVEKWDKNFHELSGGEKQRGLIARGIVWDPEILLLDEPFSNIDPSGRVELARKIGELARRKLVLVTSHDPMLLLKYTKRILLINRGVYVYGRPSEVLEKDIASKIYGSAIIEVQKHIHILDSHA